MVSIPISAADSGGLLLVYLSFANLYDYDGVVLLFQALYYKPVDD
jgi:hypothetical protein